MKRNEHCEEFEYDMSQLMVDHHEQYLKRDHKLYIYAEDASLPPNNHTSQHC